MSTITFFAWIKQILRIDLKRNRDNQERKKLCATDKIATPEIKTPINECSEEKYIDETISTVNQIECDKSATITFDKLIENFIQQFEFDPTKETPFIYHEGNLDVFQCVLAVSELALQHRQIKNLFPDDDTVVYFSTFPKDNPALIALMDFVLKKSMCIESFSIYGSDGNAVLNELYMDAVRPYQRKPLSKEANLFQENALQYPNNRQLKEYIKQLYDFFNAKFFDGDRFQYATVNEEFNFDIYLKICEIIGVDAGTSIRWKNEFNLFCLVKKHYPDTIYQFRAPWLGAQSLDIFIPSLNVGIEYQGAQHYKSVTIFGGEDEFQNRKANDEKKKSKCIENNLQLIEWPYTDKISEGALKMKLENLGFIVPPAQKFKLLIRGNEHSIKYTASDNIVNFFEQALHDDNLAEKLYRIEGVLKRNDCEELRKIFYDASSNFSERAAAAFLKIVLRYDSPIIYQTICNDEKLLDFWTHTGILNFYGRKILFTLENQNPGSDYAAKYLKKMRVLQKKNGINPDSRSMNVRLRRDAIDNGISEERIKAILRKAY